MKWQHKAAIARVCARLPFGDRLYRFGQRHVGQLRAQPLVRLATQLEMVRWLSAAGVAVHGGRFFEVGTGHMPIVPIGFYLSGARECRGSPGCFALPLSLRLARAHAPSARHLT